MPFRNIESPELELFALIVFSVAITAILVSAIRSTILHVRGLEGEEAGKTVLKWVAALGLILLVTLLVTQRNHYIRF